MLSIAVVVATPLFAELSQVVVKVGQNETIVLQRHDDAGIKIDGDLSESVWEQLPAYDEFVVIEPDTLAETNYATRVRFFYDESGIYVGIDMDQPAETLIARLSGRDRREINRDSINLTLDTSGEGRYGYWFGINLGDTLMDGTFLPERQFSSDWDGAWRGASHVTDYGWSGEFHIPWGTVAMPRTAEQRRLGMYMSRKVAHVDERWGWPGLPATQPKFASALQGLQVTGIDPRQQYSVYPFMAVTEDRVDNDVTYRSGADFFWRPSTNFQITATVNPDFGAVESDDVVINLTATETFFPEKRLFFLEGQEIFVASPRADTRGRGVGQTGAPTTLINTRRIGGVPLEPSGIEVSDRDLIQPVELLGAAKVTGQYERLRYGVLAAFEDDVGFEGGEPSDYGVARVLYEDAPGGAYRAFGVLSTTVVNRLRDASTHGVDGHYLSAGGKMKIDGQLFVSDIEGVDTGVGGFLDFQYTFRQGLRQRLGIEYNDEHVDINDLGFLQRNDYFQIRSAHTRHSTNLGWARDNELDIRGFVRRSNSERLFLGGGLFLSNRTTFNDLSRLIVRVHYFSEGYDDLNSFGNGSYRIEERHEGYLIWNSDTSKPFSYGFGGAYLQENLGGGTVHANMNLSWRPSDRFALSASVAYWNRDGWLLHQEDKNFTTFKAEQWAPKVSVDYFLNAKQQLRFSLQWVGIKAKEDEFFLVPDEPGDLIPVAKPPGPPDNFSLSQMSMQLRYRWEIAPLSDVFLVYTRLVDEGSRLKSFSDTFSDGYHNPIGDLLVLKVRYRFGS